MKRKFIKCAVCNSNKYALLFPANFSLSHLNAKVFSARRLPDKIHYRIVRCQKCGLIYSNPILLQSEIESLYKESNYTYGSLEKDLKESYGLHLKKIIKDLPKHDNFLEIGCGNGFFLEQAKQFGFKRVFGVEPGKEIIKQAKPNIRKRIIVDVFRKNQFKRNYFDLVCLFQTLDHLSDPNGALREIYRILKPGGGVLCINHDTASFQAKLLGEKSPIFDIEHIYLFDKKTIDRIFKNNKFKVVTVFNVLNRYSLNYLITMFPMPIFFKKTLLKLLGRTKLGEKRFWLRLGNLGIYAVKNQ